MPIYEFKCKSCNHEFETLVMGGKSDIFCPSCNSKEVTRELSTFASHGTDPGGGSSSSCSGCSSTSCSTCG